MRILVVDDKQLAIDSIMRSIDELGVGKSCYGTTSVQKALVYARANEVDVAFLDIEMPEMNGIEVAKRLKDMHADINIVFVTAFPEYAMDAHDMFVSGFLLKPASTSDIQRALDNLRHPVLYKPAKRLSIHCFGNFEAFGPDGPLVFRRSKSKELLAYLVDCRGMTVTMGQIETVLWEDDAHTASLHSQLRMLISDLRHALEEAGAKDVLVRRRNIVGVDVTQFDCDYYDFLEGKPEAVNLYHGEYMTQYSWAEMTLAHLGHAEML